MERGTRPSHPHLSFRKDLVAGIFSGHRPTFQGDNVRRECDEAADSIYGLPPPGPQPTVYRFSLRHPRVHIGWVQFRLHVIEEHCRSQIHQELQASMGDGCPLLGLCEGEPRMRLNRSPALSMCGLVCLSFRTGANVSNASRTALSSRISTLSHVIGREMLWRFPRSSMTRTPSAAPPAPAGPPAIGGCIFEGVDVPSHCGFPRYDDAL